MQINWLDENISNPSDADTAFNSERYEGYSPLVGFPEDMVLLDCETTGGKPTYHRITEIGLLKIRRGKVVDVWQTFINPEMAIPENIQRLTGITDHMVAQAPKFYDIADELMSRLEGAIFVAHNARFDYGFIKNECKRIGITYNAKTLCSVKLSRLWYPQFPHHGLDKIIKRFSFSIINRHRAYDDAEIIFKFFHRTSEILPQTDIEAAINSLLSRPALPRNLEESEVTKLPNMPGVYYFYDSKDVLLYIGKSVNIRNRVMSHFSQDHKSHKGLRISQRIAHIDFVRTPTDFGAQVLESAEIKRLSPIFNHKLRKTKKLYQYECRTNDDGYNRVDIKTVTPALEPMDNIEKFGLFRSKRQAQKNLQKLADQFVLCHKLAGLESDNKIVGTPCFRFQLKKCFGACANVEQPQQYNIRLHTALKNYQVKLWPWPSAILIVERDQSRDTQGKLKAECDNEERFAYHLIDAWQYIAKLDTPQDIYDYGYSMPKISSSPLIGSPTTAIEYSNDYAVNNNEIVTQLGIEEKERCYEDQNQKHEATPISFDMDIYFILVRFLFNRKEQESGLEISLLSKLT